MNFFSVKISYNKILENGIEKRVTEQYLIDALSWTEAEARAFEELKPYTNGEFTISDIRPYPINELFFNANGDRYYRAKVIFIGLDEKSGMEKKTAVYMLAQASDIQEAKDVIVEGMKGTLASYEIGKIEETKIMDVLPYI
jgi:hypothetical protein